MSNTTMYEGTDTTRKINTQKFMGTILKKLPQKVRHELFGDLSDKEILKSGAIAVTILATICTLLGILSGGKEDTATPGSTNTDSTTTLIEVPVSVPDTTTETSQDLVTDIDKTKTNGEGSSTTGTTEDDSELDLSEYIQYTTDTPVNGSESKRTAKEGVDYKYFDDGKGFEIFSDSETDLSALDILKQQKINYNVRKINMGGESLTYKAVLEMKKKFPNISDIYAPFINDDADHTLAIFLDANRITWTNTGYLTYFNQSQEEQEKDLTALLNALQWGGEKHMRGC